MCLANILKATVFCLTAWCPSGWAISPTKSKCFKLIWRFKSWNESENRCMRYGGHLAGLTSSEELSLAQKLCGQAANGCWAGGRMMNSTIGFIWKWSNNTSHMNKSIVPEPFPLNCTSLSCRNSIAADLCSLVNGTADLVAERCNTSHAFICMRDVGMPLPNASRLDSFAICYNYIVRFIYLLTKDTHAYVAIL